MAFTRNTKCKGPSNRMDKATLERNVAPFSKILIYAMSFRVCLYKSNFSWVGAHVSRIAISRINFFRAKVAGQKSRAYKSTSLVRKG